MRLVNTSNGGVAEVSQELGERLMATGTWAEPKKATRRTRKTTPKTEEKEEE